MKASLTTHGMSGHPLYNTWAKMMDRCFNENSHAYPYYGGRGITVCEGWLTVEAFIASAPPKASPSLTLDRIDNNGDYSPENCRWADRITQGSNKKNNVLVTHEGVTKTAAQLARDLGLNRSVIYSRIKRGRPLF